jgi:hypothetical protein
MRTAIEGFSSRKNVHRVGATATHSKNAIREPNRSDATIGLRLGLPERARGRGFFVS